MDLYFYMDNYCMLHFSKAKTSKNLFGSVHENCLKQILLFTSNVTFIFAQLFLYIFIILLLIINTTFCTRIL